MRIGLFITCVADLAFPAAGHATVEILQGLGHEVVFPDAQTCCGQMHLNSGYPDQARGLAERFVDVFSDFDAIVAPSSSCVGAIRELYPQVLGIEAAALDRVYELSEFLVNVLGIDDLGARFPHRVTYHPTCHSLRVARIGDAPMRLLQLVSEIELVELPRASECCGFGGTFALKNAETSSSMVADKCQCIEETGADYCAAVDGSCLLNIGGTLSRRGAAVQPIHIAEILAAR